MNFSGRGLSLMKRGLGVVCLLDAMVRLSQVRFMYSDLGALPRDAAYRFFDQPYAISLGMISGQPLFAAAILAAITVLGLLKLMGKESQRGRVLLWALVLSIQMRNPAVLDAGDDLLRLLLFWDMFLPNELEPGRPFTSWPAVGLQAQLSFALAFVGLGQWTTHSRLGQALAVAFGLGLLALWIPRTRKILIWPAIAGALLWAFLWEPVFGLSLFSGLLIAIGVPSDRTILDRSERRLALAVCVALLVSLGWSVLPRPRSIWPLRVIGESIGLSQDWHRTYPPAHGLQHSLTLKTGQTSWTLPTDRHSRLFTEALLKQPGLAEPLARAFMRSRALEGAVEVWLSTGNEPEVLIHSTTYRTWRHP